MQILPTVKKLFLSILIIGFGSAGLAAGAAAAAVPDKVLVMQNIGYLKLPGDITLNPLKKMAGPAWELTGKDQDVSRYARLMSSEYLPARLGVDKSLFTGKVQSAAKVSEAVKKYMARYLAQNGGHLLNFYPAEAANIDKRRAWVFSMQADLGYDISFPVFIKTYMLVTDTRVSEVMLVCPDSDRRFWEPIIRKAMSEVRGDR